MSQMPWQVQTFWLVGRRTGKRLLAISAVSGSRARHQGPAVDKRRRVFPSSGQLLAPGVDDLAALALRRCYERLEAGEAAVSLQDAVATMRLAWQIERDEAIPRPDKALAALAEAQQAVLSLKDAIIRRFGRDEWRALWDEAQRARETRRMRQRFATAVRPVHQPPT